MNEPTQRFQFGLTSIFLATGACGAVLGIWAWLSEAIPALLAAVVVFCWTVGAALLALTSLVRFDNPWRASLVPLLVGLGCTTMLLGPLAAAFLWSRPSTGSMAVGLIFGGMLLVPLIAVVMWTVWILE
jgi:hypothetical protein